MVSGVREGVARWSRDSDMSVSRRASFAAGIAAVRRQKKAVRNMTKDNIQEDVAEGRRFVTIIY